MYWPKVWDQLIIWRYVASLCCYRSRCPGWTSNRLHQRSWKLKCSISRRGPVRQSVNWDNRAAYVINGCWLWAAAHWRWNARSHGRFVGGQQAGKTEANDWFRENRSPMEGEHSSHKVKILCRFSLKFRKIWRGNQKLLLLEVYYGTRRCTVGGHVKSSGTLLNY